MKSRLYCAVICYVLAFVLLVICVPISKKITYPKTDGIILKTDILKGRQIGREDIEIVTIGALNLPKEVFHTADEVVGRYAKMDLVEGDLVFSAKISQLPLDGDYPQNILPVDHTAQLIQLKMIEGSEYAHPETGDIVKLSRFQDRLIDIPELQFVRVLSILPSEEEWTEVTVSVSESQNKYLEKYKEEVFYSSVIVRSNEELAEKLLTEQRTYFEER